MPRRTVRESDAAKAFRIEFEKAYPLAEDLLLSLERRISWVPFVGFPMGGEPTRYAMKSDPALHPGIPQIRLVYTLISNDVAEIEEIELLQ